MFAVLFLSLSVSLSNFAGAIGIGISGVNKKVRLYTISIWVFFESVMPVIGFIIGKSFLYRLDGYGHSIGAMLLIMVGLYDLWEARIQPKNKKQKHRGIKLRTLILSGFALSIDNFLVGFTIAYNHVSIIILTILILLISSAFALTGLEIGHHLGKRYRKWSDELSAVTIMLVGFLLLFHIL